MTYVSETFPAKQCGAYQGWVMRTGLVGIPMTACVARFTVPIASWGWRLVFIWGSLGLLVLPFANHLEESPRWYENHGKLAEADAVLDRIEARSRAEFSDLPPAPETVEEPLYLGRYTDLLATTYLPRTAMLIAVLIVISYDKEEIEERIRQSNPR